MSAISSVEPGPTSVPRGSEQLSRYVLCTKGDDPASIRLGLDGLATAIRRDIRQAMQTDTTTSQQLVILNGQLGLVNQLRALGRVYEVNYGLDGKRCDQIRPAFCALYERAAQAGAPIILTTVRFAPTV